MAARAALGEPIASAELTLASQSKTVHCSVWASPILTAEAMPDGAVVMAADVSERRALEAQMQQAQRLESLGVLAGGIAHDFNNLLTGVIGNASLLQEMFPELLRKPKCAARCSARARAWRHSHPRCSLIRAADGSSCVHRSLAAGGADRPAAPRLDPQERPTAAGAAGAAAARGCRPRADAADHHEPDRQCRRSDRRRTGSGGGQHADTAGWRRGIARAGDGRAGGRQGSMSH